MAAGFAVHPAPLHQLLAGPGGGVAAAMLRLGITVATGAKRRCPVDTGRLRASIGAELHADSRGPVVTVGSNVVYARFVEGGTRYMAARPFLRDALAAALAGPIR